MAGLDLYKELIDALVAKTGADALAAWVRKGSYPDVPGNEDINGLLVSLTDEQRQIVARMVHEARSDGFHDAIVVMLTEGGFRMTKDGAELPFEPFGTESYFDYVARLAGQEWPEDDQPLARSNAIE
jgi:Family of unknown function (DUF6547)